MSNALINAYIRRRGRRRAPPQDRAAAVERELAEARVALDVANGEPESVARIRHGLASTGDWGGGPRGGPRLPEGPSANEWLREEIARKRGIG